MATRQTLADDLRALGLGAGDAVLVHSSLASLGRVEGGARTVVEAFLDVLGPAGTLVVPTFGSLGVITDTVKAWPGAVMSLHPLASVAAVGAHAEALCRDHWKAELGHGPDTPYMRLAELGGFLCLLGVDQDRNTTLHTVEELLRLPYLKTSATKTFDTPDGPVTKAWPFFPGPHRDFIGLDAAFRTSGKMRLGRVGEAVARLIKSQDLLDIGLALGRQDPAFALCRNPACEACVRQRADLRRAGFGEERFRLAAAASLAGRYVPEIVDTCRLAGVDAVELDGLKGRPLEAARPDDIPRAVAELRAGGLAVSALRAGSLQSSVDKLVEAARAAGVPRLVLPLSPAAAEHTGRAAAHGLEISFFNAAVDSATASEWLLAAQAAGARPGFTFSAGGFARAGENPFLGSYKKKLRRFVDQLDVEDCLWDGTPRALAQGNAEIKELISILRCASFSGWMVLAAGNRFAGTLADAAGRFAELLAHL